MKLERIRCLRGPNLWTRLTAIEAHVTVSDQDLPAGKFAEFQRHLRERFPALDSAPMVAYEASLTLPRVLERAALTFQLEAGVDVSFSRTVPNGEPGYYKVIVEFRQEEVGRMAFDAAWELVQATFDDRPFDAELTIQKLRTLDQQIRLGPSTGSIVKAAIHRGVPIRRLNDGSLVQLGWGARQHRILAAETDRTPAIAESIAQDKELTKTLLRAVGVPVPEGRPVKDAEDAWAAALEVGMPVVVKPQFGNQGRGVTVNLNAKEAILKAYDYAHVEGRSIIVERFSPGADFRLLVIGGRLVAAARRDPPQVVGDGTRSVRELVEVVNQDPRRGEDHATSLSKIPLDAIAMSVLQSQELTQDSVPARGVTVYLRKNGNLSTGGSATDVTHEVHPEIVDRAIDAASVIGLDIAGVDVICKDITKPLEDQGGCIVEINAAPGMRMHLEPSSGKGRPVGEAVVSAMFNPSDNGRIPLVAVTGTNGKTTTVRLVAHMLKIHGRCVGMSCTDGLYVNGRRMDTGDCSGPKSARSLLLNPQVEAAVLETARGGILREGLGFDKCDIAIVTNIGGGDHLGMNGIRTSEQLAQVKQVVVQNVAKTGFAVLNAADSLTAGMAEQCPGSIIFFAHDARHPTVAAHKNQGGRVIYVKDGAITAAEGDREYRLVDVAAVPLTQVGRARFQIENAMAATAAAWGLGVPWDTIRAGLMSFVNDMQHAPARFNVLTYAGATIIIDYGHNPDALLALVDTVDRMPNKKRHVMISAAGDRRDIDIIRQTEILGGAFDEVILYEDACNRGRAEGEVVGLLRKGLANAHRATKVTEIKGEFVAIETCLSHLRPGDLALILIDQVEASLDFIQRMVLRPPTRHREEQAGWVENA
jgi:cyanophycin synthetase